MPKYEVELKRTITEIATIEVEAADEEEAERKAKSLAAESIDRSKDSHPDVSWDLDDDSIEVEFSSEIGED